MPRVTASEPGAAQLENRVASLPEVSSGEASAETDRAQVPGTGTPGRVRAPSGPEHVSPLGADNESGCLGMHTKSGGKLRPSLNTDERPIAKKYREGKMKRTLKRDTKSA